VAFFFLLLLFLPLRFIVRLEDLVCFILIFFESRLIPTLFVSLGWGYKPERVQAGIYVLLDTLLVSLPLLFGILLVSNSLGSLSFNKQ
jgi:NADH-ubiquinone oxidoreductase chain 4